MTESYDAVLVVSFGGPEGPDDVIPFLKNVFRDKKVPPHRLAEIAEDYEPFGGVSPVGEQNRALVAALVCELNAHGPLLPVYWGNRNWHPLLKDTLSQMADDGIRHALAFFTSPYGAYSTCRQYLEDIDQARETIGPAAPQVDRLRLYYNHPGFIESQIERCRAAIAELPPERRDAARVFFTAHSLPLSMAGASRYAHQLQEVCTLLSGALSLRRWQLAYQSRSGPPTQQWLGPDVCDALRELASGGAARDVLIVPIGFLSDHMEVVRDLDVAAQSVCDELGLNMVRASTVGTHPRFVRMIRELIVERISGAADRPALGGDGAAPDVCPVDCCLGEG